ncbi:CdaR family transcriptional regulator [Fusibacter sp. 3D3]|uniref:PucR family transcriptional regulator n=1 Tax=Fusibacter sp. 3D3 TaxID=1048380 RepID=UPI00085537D4|nr:helix-turn-helix domain-containing protein [Fusibacter sp. 3D3]GAU78407.1 regulator of polyketide synthase expression [Fusibacter sp. 3D3]
MINSLCKELEAILKCEVEVWRDKNKPFDIDLKWVCVRISSFDDFDLIVHKALTALETEFVTAWVQKGLILHEMRRIETRKPEMCKPEISEFQLLIEAEAYKNYYKILQLPIKLWRVRYKENHEEVMEVIRSAFGEMLFVNINASEVVIFVTNAELAPIDLLDMIEAEAYTSAQIAVGNVINQMSELHEGYNQLEELMQLGRHLKQNTKVVTYEGLVLPLLIQRLKRPLASEITNPSAILSEVLKQQLKSVGDEELEQTAMSFFECNLNITETAHKLFIHRNTLIYRLNKLETITGYDIRKFNDAINYYLNYLVDKIQ